MIPPDPLIFPSAADHAADPRCDVQSVELVLTGDVMMHGGEIRAALQPDGTYSLDGWFEGVRPWLEGADVAAAQLETTIAGEEDEGYSGYPRFNSPSAVLDELARVGVDVLQTSNNHCLDRGEDGAEHTIAEVEARGFLHTGTYTSREDRDTPYALIDAGDGVTIGFVAYTYGTEAPPPLSRWWRVAYIDQRRFQWDIAATRAAGADIVVVGLHWGLEYRDQPEADMVELGRWLTEVAGADIVWGTHPHVVQPGEVRTVAGPQPRDGLVLYSMGNFVSNQRDPKRDGAAIAQIRIDTCPRSGDAWLADAQLVPTWVDDRDRAGRSIFHVLPAASTPADCRSEFLDASDCAAMVRQYAHVQTLFSASNVSWSRKPVLDDSVGGGDGGGRWFRYWP